MRIFFLFFSLLCFSCAQATAKKPVQNETEPELVNEVNVSSDTVSLDDIPIYGNFDDMEYIFEQNNDTTYVINFWATWCKPCVEELPFFADLHTNFRDEKMKVILVSLDFPNKLESKLVPFINTHQLESDVMVLTDGAYNKWIDKVDEEWGGAIPITLVYKGNDREFVGRPFENTAELNDLVERFLKS